MWGLCDPLYGIKMEKYYNEKRQVGVIISPSFGAGWSTWNDDNPWLVFYNPLVEAVLQEDQEKIKHIAETFSPDGFFYCRRFRSCIFRPRYDVSYS